MMRLLVGLALLLCSVRDVLAEDAVIDKSIAHEPEYSTHDPRYCLALLGPERLRLWIVLDGTHAFVDKNLDGAITIDERIEPERSDTDPASFPKTVIKSKTQARPKTFVFDMAIFNWFDLKKSADIDAIEPAVFVRFPDKKYFGAWGDHNGKLRFAKTSANAPVIRLGTSSLKMGFEVRQPLKKAKEPNSVELSAAIGIPGKSHGTFAWLGYGTIPQDTWPDAEFLFPSKKTNGQQIRSRTKLDHRC